MPKGIRETFGRRRWVLPLHGLTVAAAALTLFAKRAGFDVLPDFPVAIFGIATVCMAYIGTLADAYVTGGLGIAMVGAVLSDPSAPFVYTDIEDRVTMLATLIAFPLVATLVRAMQSRAEASHEKLAEAEQLWKLLAAHVPGALATLSSDGRIYFVNRPFPWLEDGRNPVGEPLVDVLPEQMRAQITKALPKIWSSGESYRIEIRLVSPAGTSFLYDLRIERVIRDHEAMAMLASFIDISDRQTQEDAHARLSAIVHASNAAIFGATLDGAITSWNPAARRIYGYSADEIIGKPFAALFPEGRSFEAAAPYIEAATKGESSESAEMLHRKKDGSPLTVSLSVSPIEHHGSVTGIAVIARDISSQRRDAEERRRTLALLAEAEKVAHVGSWEWDMARDAMTWTDELYRIYGYEPGSVRPSIDAYLRPIEPTDREKVHNAITSARHDGKEFAFDHRILRDDGVVRTLRVHGAPYKDLNGKSTRLIGTVHDVTEQRALEIELMAKHRALETEIAKRTSQLRVSETRLKSVLEGGPIVLWLTDKDGIFTFIGGEGLKGIGLNPGDVENKSLFELYKGSPSIVESVKKTLSGQSVRATVETEGHTFETTQIPQFDDAGRVTGMLGVAIDVTDLSH